MQLQIDKFGDNGVLFRWPQTISGEIHRDILALDAFLRKEHTQSLLETVVAYNELAVFLKEGQEIDRFIRDFSWTKPNDFVHGPNSITYVVPVCYDLHFAKDLSRVAEHCGMRKEEVILLHTSVKYEVKFIGFLPGFPYLSGLDRRLHTPRLAEPRKSIEKGAVGIGGKQTGVYTMKSPGGWNIIGRSPLSLFRVEASPPSVFQPGDNIVFEAISMQEFKRIESLVEMGTFEIQRIT